jgi:catechol 2,3-dioxygenase-like lactoylglutathione lyase family enzyme
MEHIIAQLLQDFEQGKMSRRQLIQTLALTAMATSGLGSGLEASAAGIEGLKAASVNHIHFAVHDYAKVRDFYANLFGMKVLGDNNPEKPKHCHLKCGDTFLTLDGRSASAPTTEVQHIAIGIENFDKKRVDAVLKDRGIEGKWTTTSSQAIECTTNDPEGFQVQIVSKSNIPA